MAMLSQSEAISGKRRQTLKNTSDLISIVDERDAGASKNWRHFCRPANFYHPWYNQDHRNISQCNRKILKKNDVTTFAPADELLQNPVDCIKLRAKR